MSTSRYQLLERDGKLFVVWISTSFNSPALIKAWFPTGLRAAQCDADLIGRDLTRSSPGLYAVNGVRTPDGNLLVRLRDGERTIAEHNDYIDLKPPTEGAYWRDGQWWKQTKRGPVPIGVKF